MRGGVHGWFVWITVRKAAIEKATGVGDVVGGAGPEPIAEWAFEIFGFVVGARARVAAGTVAVLGNVERRVGEMSVFALVSTIFFGAADGVGIDSDGEGFGDREATDHGGGDGGIVNRDR